MSYMVGINDKDLFKLIILLIVGSVCVLIIGLRLMTSGLPW